MQEVQEFHLPQNLPRPLPDPYSKESLFKMTRGNSGDYDSFYASRAIGDQQIRDMFWELRINWDSCARDNYALWKECYHQIRRHSRYTNTVNGHRV